MGLRVSHISLRRAAGVPGVPHQFSPGRGSVSIPGRAVPGRGAPGVPGRGAPGVPGRGAPGVPGRGASSVQGRGAPSVPGRGASSVPGRGASSVQGRWASSVPAGPRVPRAVIPVPIFIAKPSCRSTPPSEGPRSHKSRKCDAWPPLPKPDETLRQNTLASWLSRPGSMRH
jgi:hypothetical protein